MGASFARFGLALCFIAVLLPATLHAGNPLNASDGLSAFAAESEGTPTNENNAFDQCAVNAPPSFEASASLLFLQPSSGNMTYATSIYPYPILSPHWSDQAVSPSFSPAFNIGMRYIIDCSADIQLGWTHLNTFDQAATYSAMPLPPVPGIPPLSGPASTQALGPPFLIGPPPPYASARAVAHFAYDAVNLDAGLFFGSGHVRVRPFAGLQLARINQSLSTNFQTSNGAFSFTDVSQSLFTGVGPRLGMDMHYLAGNLDLVGGIAGAILMGTRRSGIDFFTAGPQDAAAGIAVNAQSLTSPSATQAIPAIDAKLGGSYVIPLGRFGLFKCEAGYQAAVYFNVINQYSLSEVENNLPLQIEEGTAATFLRTAMELQSNFMVHGPYLKFSLQF